MRQIGDKVTIVACGEITAIKKDPNARTLLYTVDIVRNLQYAIIGEQYINTTIVENRENN